MFSALRKSGLIHIAIIALLIALAILPKHGKGDKEGKGDGKYKQKDTKFIEANESKTFEVTLQSNSAKKKADEKEVKCVGQWYGGVGLQNDFTDMIVEIAPFYPAYKAGLRLGDILITPPNTLRGDPGTIIDVTVKRGEDFMTFRVTRGKICYQEAP
jgi:membrane-associated protease RseP (regulator of RpoE activity)